MILENKLSLFGLSNGEFHMNENHRVTSDFVYFLFRNIHLVMTILKLAANG
jgi:hypothetical protein